MAEALRPALPVAAAAVAVLPLQRRPPLAAEKGAAQRLQGLAPGVLGPLLLATDPVVQDQVAGIW